MKDGRLIPFTVIWENGTVYAIDYVKEIKRFAKNGKTRFVYTCVVEGKECHLHYEGDKWYMERKR